MHLPLMGELPRTGSSCGAAPWPEIAWKRKKKVLLTFVLRMTFPVLIMNLPIWYFNLKTQLLKSCD